MTTKRHIHQGTDIGSQSLLEERAEVDATLLTSSPAPTGGVTSTVPAISELYVEPESGCAQII